MLPGLWSYVSGYAIIKAKGPHLERFINAAVRQRIHLWRVERLAHDAVVARAAAASFSRLAAVARRVGVSLVIVGKAGLPFAVRRLARRYMLAAGGWLFIGLLYLLSSFVWFVQVEGTEDLEPADVLAVAARFGLRPGTLRGGFQRDAVERALYLELPRLAWATVEVHGVRATIHVAERVVLGPGLMRPGHVVAERAGIVEKVVVLAGVPVVRAGETVAQGQVLISGLLPPASPAQQEKIARGELPYIRADGTVTARTWYEGYGEAPLVEERHTDTGRRRRTVTLAVGERRLAVGLAGGVPFRDYRTEVRERRLWSGPPAVVWRVSTYYEVRREFQEIDHAEARRHAAQAAWAEARAGLPPEATVVDSREEVVGEARDGQVLVRVRVTVEAVQDIGRFEPIGR